MRKFRTDLIVAMLSIFMSFSAFSQNSSYETTKIDGKEFYIYNVGHAEGFYSLTRRFNVSQQEIEKYNPETKAGLKNGQRILIPVQSDSIPAKSTSEQYFIHTVQPGETLNALSRTYQVSVNDIMALNPGMDKSLIIGHEVRIPQAANLYVSSESDYLYHTIEPKETLFSVARKYNTTMKDIVNDNPGLNENTFAVGKVIRIGKGEQASLSSEPVAAFSTTTYQVQKKETLYSISRKFDVSLTSLLELNPGISRVKAGDTIRIPVTADNSTAIQSNPSETAQQMHEILSETSRISKEDRISVVLLLPLQLYNSVVNSAMQNRYLEFYEGFLMAVDSLKEEGASLDLHVFDTDSKKMSDILARPEVANASLIIGPADNALLSEVCRFADQHGINVVNPFTFDAEAAENNPHLFQLNTPNSYLYAESSIEFANIFRDNTIVFLKEAGKTEEKKEFVEYLHRELDLRQMRYIDYEYTDASQLSEVDSILNLNGPVVFMPLAADKQSLGLILPPLHNIQRNNPSVQISLFGYPEWQTQSYMDEFMDYFYELNTYIYTRIYTNPFSAETKSFQKRFQYWYNKEMRVPAYPIFGILGFDTGMFFLQAVNKYGKNFDNHIDMIPAASLQTAMCFRRINNWSGFINRCIYFVNFRPDSTIEKIEVK